MINCNNLFVKHLKRIFGQMHKEHRKTECDAKCKQYTISIDCPKMKFKVENCMKAKGNCLPRVHLDQMILGSVGQ
jgi:lipid A disaccharide synthetase